MKRREERDNEQERDNKRKSFWSFDRKSKEKTISSEEAPVIQSGTLSTDSDSTHITTSSTFSASSHQSSLSQSSSSPFSGFLQPPPRSHLKRRDEYSRFSGMTLGEVMRVTVMEEMTKLNMTKDKPMDLSDKPMDFSKKSWNS